METVKNLSEASDSFAELVNEFKNSKEFSELVPDFDEQSLMVHWTNYS